MIFLEDFTGNREKEKKYDYDKVFIKNCVEELKKHKYTFCYSLEQIKGIEEYIGEKLKYEFSQEYECYLVLWG